MSRLPCFLEGVVASGLYHSANEVICEALRLLEQRELEHQAALKAVKQKIAVGLEQARRGELRDGEEVFRDLDRRGG